MDKLSSCPACQGSKWERPGVPCSFCRAAPSSSADELPPLPEPDHALDCGSQPFFTAEQLRSFGHACYRMGQTAAIQAAAPAPTTTKNVAVRFDGEDAREQQQDGEPSAASLAAILREIIVSAKADRAWLIADRARNALHMLAAIESCRATGTDRAQAGEAPAGAKEEEGQP